MTIITDRQKRHATDEYVDNTMEDMYIDTGDKLIEEVFFGIENLMHAPKDLVDPMAFDLLKRRKEIIMEEYRAWCE